MVEEEQKTKQIKKDIPMNILICGSKIERYYIESIFDDKTKKTYKKYYNYEEYSYLYGWKFQFFKEGLKKNILDSVFEKIKEDFKEDFSKNLILCFIEDNFQNAEDVITYFSSLNILYHTFIILVTNNKEITKQKVNEFIFEKLENEFDPRNVEILQYIHNNPMSLFKVLFDKACYFNEMGNLVDIPSLDQTTFLKKDKGNHNFNILVIGKPGTGKSTFINIINGKKVAKEGTGGGKVTNDINYYRDEGTNIVLYDTPGFGTNEELPKVKKFVTNEIKNMKEKNEKFHCIIYLLSHSDARDFDKPEEILILKLLELKVPFYFILNKSTKPNLKLKKKKKSRDDKKDILEEQIKCKLKKNSDPNFDYPKVICLNLRTNENSSCFGLDLLFKDLFDFYKPYKIDLNSLILNKNKPNIVSEKIKNNPFFEGYTSKEEILNNLIVKCKYEISGFSALSAAVGFIPIPLSDAPILITIQVAMIIAIAAQFGIEKEKNEAKDMIIKLSKSTAVGATVAGVGKIVGSLIKLVPGIGSVVGGAICGSTAGIGTYTLGMATITFFKDQFTDDDAFNFILNRAKTLNSIIKLFEEYSEKFKDTNEEISQEDDYIFLLMK